MSTNSNEPLIDLNQVKFSYSTESHVYALNLTSWQVHARESVLLIGSSGSGKSTLLNLLSGIITPDSGQVSVAGYALESLMAKQRDYFRATQIGYVAQSFNLIPYLSAIDNIKLTNYFAQNSTEESNGSSIETLLLELNITQTQWHKPVNRLSIGQQQRVAIARAIVNKPKLLIADEPTSALDQANRDQFMSILMTTADAHNMTLVFVSHDLSLKRYFHRVDSMSDINNIED
ncbi:MAG: putative ABC transport system ATP-binding protein [Gammaproteobacteria bacterium]|jgi:putative ABC transport system ATP-binding protein